MRQLLKNRWTWRVVLWGLLGLGMCGIVLAWRAEHNSKVLADPKYARQNGEPIPVRTAYVEEKEVEQVIGATAVTVAAETGIIRIGASRELSANSPLSDIVIKKVHVYEGDFVRRGQVLYEIDNSVFAQVVKEKKAKLATATANVEYIKESNILNEKLRELDVATAKTEIKYRTEDLENKQNLFDIIAKLYKSSGVAGGATTVIDYYNARSALAQAKFTLAQAEHDLAKATDMVAVGLLNDQYLLAKATTELEIARLDVDTALRDASRFEIKSPIDGFVHYSTPTDIVAGAVVSTTSTFCDVLKLDPIHVKLDFPQERMEEVKIGQEAEVILDCYPKETFHGKVLRISPQVSPELRVFSVIVEVPNPDYRIKAGVSGYVRVRSMKKALTVPVAAVLPHDTKSMAFRVENGRARIKEVRTGHLLDNNILEVRGGLDKGDEVVIFYSNVYTNSGGLIEYNAYLQDNDLVNTDWRKWGRRTPTP
jgi:RND family efflux transporter MFP subunit